TASTSRRMAFQGSANADFADNSAGLPAACSDMPGPDMPGPKQPAAFSRRRANSECCDLDDQTLEWLSAAVRDELKAIVQKELHEALQKLWPNAG
ncbi:hypothetical protein MTO96_045844, partial [Rhipicephalus appendiculatus]